jgi:hypothetical protein
VAIAINNTTKEILKKSRVPYTPAFSSLINIEFCKVKQTDEKDNRKAYKAKEMKPKSVLAAFNSIKIISNEQIIAAIIYLLQSDSSNPTAISLVSFCIIYGICAVNITVNIAATDNTVEYIPKLSGEKNLAVYIIPIKLRICDSRLSMRIIRD